jgi:hypothetical protein
MNAVVIRLGGGFDGWMNKVPETYKTTKMVGTRYLTIEDSQI